MSLDWLLGPQLRGVRRRRLRGHRRVGGGPARRGHRGARHPPRRAARTPRGRWRPARTCLRCASCTSVFRRAATDDRAHAQPQAGLVRAAGRPARARVPVVVNTIHGLYALPDDPLPKRAVVYGLERIAATCSDAGAGAEPGGPRDARAPRRAAREAARARQRHRPDALRATGVDDARRAAGRAPTSAWPTTTWWSAPSVGSSRRRATSSCSRRCASCATVPRRAWSWSVPTSRRRPMPSRRRGLDAAAADAGVVFLGAATTSTCSTAPWTCTCWRRTARASLVPPWRRPPWGCRSSPPTSAVAEQVVDDGDDRLPGRRCVDRMADRRGVRRVDDRTDGRP